MRIPQTAARAVRVTVSAFLLAEIVPVDALAQRTKTSQRAGEQRKAETGLKDNRYFSISSIPPFRIWGRTRKKALSRGDTAGYPAQLLYMKFQFRNPTARSKAQRILIDLAGKRCGNIGIAGELQRIRPRVIELQDSRARGYLNLDYRDMKSARRQ